MDAEKPNGGPTERDTDQQPDKAATPASGRAIEVIQSNDREQPAEVEAADTKHPPQRFYKRAWGAFRNWLQHPNRPRPMWTDVSTVVLGIAIIFFAFMQWYEMHGSGKQTDRLIATATAIEADQKQIVTDNKQILTDNKAAIDKTLKENREEIAKLLTENQRALTANLKQGQTALDASVSASRLDQRAWIGVGNISGKPVVGESLKIIVAFQNTGRTPALATDALVAVIPLQRGKRPDLGTAVLAKLTMLPDDAPSRGLLPPAGIYSVTATLYDKTKKELHLFKDTDITSVNSGESILYLHGLVKYDDIFNRHHWTMFCYSYSPKKQQVVNTQYVIGVISLIATANRRRHRFSLSRHPRG